MSAFPWVSNGGDWISSNPGLDGYYSLQSPVNPANSVSVSIEFTAPQAGELSFAYYMTENNWQLFHNGVLVPQNMLVFQGWRGAVVTIPEGANTISWVGNNISSPFQLDSIIFPAKTLFAQARIWSFFPRKGYFQSLIWFSRIIPYLIIILSPWQITKEPMA